jgi:hypothetical protein
VAARDIDFDFQRAPDRLSRPGPSRTNHATQRATPNAAAMNQTARTGNRSNPGQKEQKPDQTKRKLRNARRGPRPDSRLQCLYCLFLCTLSAKVGKGKWFV